MGEAVAFVERSFDSRFYVTLIGNTQPPRGPFASAGLAQQAANDVASRSLRWTQVVATPEGEKWRGDDPAWWPADFQSGLVLWTRADRGVQLADVATGTLVTTGGRAWSSIDGAGLYSFTPAGTGSADTRVLGTTNKPTVRMYAAQKRLDSNFATLEKPFTVAMSARYEREISIARRAAFSSDIFRFRVATIANTWECLTSVAGTIITGPTPTSDRHDVVSAVVTATDTFFYVNGVLIGSSADEPVGAIGTISYGSSAERWSGDIAECVIVNRALSSYEHLQLLVPYMRRWSNGAYV